MNGLQPWRRHASPAPSPEQHTRPPQTQGVHSTHTHTRAHKQARAMHPCGGRAQLCSPADAQRRLLAQTQRIPGFAVELQCQVGPPLLGCLLLL